MNINELIGILNERKVYLEEQSGALKISAPKGALDKELVAIIKNKKSALIKFFSKVTLSAIQKAPKQEYYKLTPSQYRLWVSSQLGGGKAYNIPYVNELDGEVNLVNAKKALTEVIRKHDAIRTCFRFNDDREVSQFVIAPEDFEVDFTYHDLSDNPSESKTIIDQLVNHQFDLEDGPLLKVGLIKVGEEKSLLYILMHHLISDGWSMEIFFKDLIEHYQLLELGELTTPAPLALQYTDYSVWLNDNLSKINKSESNFWVKMFKDSSPVLKLPFEYNRPLKKTYSGNSINCYSSKAFYNKMDAFCKKLNKTSFGFIMASYKILLYKYAGLNDLTIGIPTSGRINEQLEDQIGLYINTLPIRSKFNAKDTFLDIFEIEHEVLKKSQDNQLFSMDYLLKELSIETPIGHSALFDIMIAYQNQNSLGFYDLEDVKDVDVKFMALNVPYSQFDISMGLGEYQGKLSIGVQYNTDIYQHDHIRKTIDDYLFLMDILIDNPDISIETLLEDTDYTFLTDAPINFKKIEEKTENNLTPDRVGDLKKTNLKEKIKSIIDKYAVMQSYQDDYFTIGGTSLGAIQIVAEINKELKTKLTIIDFYNNPSINKVNALIAESAVLVNTPPKTLVKFGERDEKLPNLFLFPPILGSSLVFLPLVDFVKKDFNTYGLNMPVLDQDTAIFENVTQQYFEEILKEHTEGEIIYLAGYSIGVNFAFEVTKLLEERGIEAILLLIDRGPEMEEAIDFTESAIAKVLKEHKPLIKLVSNGVESEELFELRIGQILKGMKGYKVEGKVSATIFSFESRKNGISGYMEQWGKYTNASHEVLFLSGNHFDAMKPINVHEISQILKKITYESASVC